MPNKCGQERNTRKTLLLTAQEEKSVDLLICAYIKHQNEKMLSMGNNILTFHENELLFMCTCCYICADCPCQDENYISSTKRLLRILFADVWRTQWHIVQSLICTWQNVLYSVLVDSCFATLHKISLDAAKSEGQTLSLPKYTGVIYLPSVSQHECRIYFWFTLWMKILLYEILQPWAMRPNLRKLQLPSKASQKLECFILVCLGTIFNFKCVSRTELHTLNPFHSRFVRGSSPRLRPSLAGWGVPSWSKSTALIDQPWSRKFILSRTHMATRSALLLEPGCENSKRKNTHVHRSVQWEAPRFAHNRFHWDQWNGNGHVSAVKIWEENTLHSGSSVLVKENFEKKK